MAGHEPITREHAVEPGSDRSFGFIVGGILAAIRGYQLFKASTLAPWFLTPGLLLVAFALVRPSMLHPLNVAWMKLGLLLGRVVTPIVMLLVFVVARAIRDKPRHALLIVQCDPSLLSLSPT